MFKILSKDSCKLCEDAVILLDDNNIPYEILKVDKDELKQLCAGCLVFFLSHFR